MTAGEAPPPAAAGEAAPPAAAAEGAPHEAVGPVAYPVEPPWRAAQWAPPPPAPRRRRRAGLLSTLLVAALGIAASVGGTVAAVASSRSSAAPIVTVERYFAAVRVGDAPAALRFAAPPVGNHDFLTSSVLAVQRRLAPMSNVRVGSARVSGNAAVVPVSYTLSPQDRPGRADEQSGSVTVHRVGHGWQLDSPAATVALVAVTASHRASLAGAALPTTPVALFPGAVPIEYDTHLIEAAPGTGYVTVSSGRTIRVGAQLSPTGRATVQADVRAAFAGCLSRGAAAPASCPLTPDGTRAVPASLRGVLSHVVFTTPPTLRAMDPDGLVATAGTFTVRGRYQALDFNNLASARTGVVSVAFRAALYASAPSVVQWQQP